MFTSSSFVPAQTLTGVPETKEKHNTHGVLSTLSAQSTAIRLQTKLKARYYAGKDEKNKKKSHHLNFSYTAKTES